MVIKYLLATLSALAQRFASSDIDINDEGNAITLNKDGFNYLNVSPTFGRFQRRRKRMIDILPKSIIMAVVLITLSSVKAMGASNDLTGLAISAGTLSFSPTNYSYTVQESSTVTSVTVTPTAAAGSTILVNDQPVTSGSASSSITLTAGSSTIITIVCTDASGTNSSTYTITVNCESITYPGTTFTYVNNQTITTMVPTTSPDAPTGANPYSISAALPTGLAFSKSTGQISGKPTGGASGPTNYTITATYASGATATVIISIQITTAKTLTISGTNVTQTYGSVTPTVTYTITGLVSGDSMISLPSVSTTATAISPAGTYPINVSGGQAPAGYTVNYVTGTFTINKVNLIIAATGPPKSTTDNFTGVYPGASTSNFTADGLVNNETITSVTLSMDVTGVQSYGSTYNVTPGPALVGANGFSTSNYNITYTSYGGLVGSKYTWTGATSRDMSLSTNWNPNGVPGTNDNIFIPDSTTVANQPDMTQNMTLNTVNIQGKSRLTLEAGKTLLFLNGFTVNAGVKLVVNMRSTTSQLTVGTTSSRATLANLGTLTVNGGVVFITYGLNYIYNQNSGTMKFQNGNTFNIGGTSGQLAFQNNGFFYAGTYNSPCTLNIVNSQSVTNGSTGNFYLGSTSTINFLDANAHDSHFSNTAGGNFTIQSDDLGSGSIGTIPAGPTNHTNSFDGLFTVERYMSGTRGYRLIASPVYAGSVTNSGVTNKIYSLNYVKNAAWITGTNASGGFDKVTQGPTLYLFREDVPYSNATFISGNYQSINNLTAGTGSAPTYTFDVTSGSWSIPISNGFLFFFRGNKADGTVDEETVTSWIPTPATMSTTGYLNQQQVVFRDWYTPTSNYLGHLNSDTLARGYNLAANPYPCSIDWSTRGSVRTTKIFTSGLSGYVYELNPYTKNYDTYQDAAHLTNSGTKTIASGQGFMVLATANNSELIINESAKAVTQQNLGGYLFMGKPADALVNNQSLRLEMALDSINKDNTLISFEPNSKAALDLKEDAPYKIGSGKLGLSSISSDNVPLAVNVTPFNNKGQTIPVNIRATVQATYTMTMKEINGIPKFFDVLLADNDAKDTVDMRKGPYSFNVSWADPNSYGAHRFVIIMRQNPEYAYQLVDFNAHKVPTAREVQVVWNAKNEENYTNFTVERSVDGGQTFAVLGGVPATGAGNYGFTDRNPVAGMNFYRLKQEDINNNITYSRIVPIGYSALSNNIAQNGINVYPNPASSKINLAIATPVAGPSSSYSILITNSSGNTLKKVTSNQPYWQGDATGWMPGTYMVKVFDAKTQSLIGTTKFIKL